MRQLSGLDAVFLNLETNAVPMHVGALVILDPSTAGTGFGFKSVRRMIEQRLHLLPMFRRRVVTAPLNLDMPYWIEDPEFDIELHVRHRALPRPGNMKQLADFICDVISTRLDRSSPLWRLYFVEGLEGGRVAVITKIHHACVDGVSGAEIMSTVLDVTPAPRSVPPPEKPWEPEPLPSPLSLALATARHLAARPGEALRLVRDTAPVMFYAGREAMARRRLARKTRRTADTGTGPAAAPRMRFNTTITARRAYACRSLSLDDVKLVKNAFGTTVNDVVLNICAEALRRYLLEKEGLPGRTLVAAVPVSVRTEAERGSGGNKVTMTRTALFTDIADPVDRLKAIARGMGRVKDGLKATPARRLMDWMDVPSPAVMAQAARLYENFSIQDYVAPPFNLVISNIPGPQHPLYMAGAKVLASYPVSIPYHGLAFNITVLSYQNNLDVGLTAYRAAVPDIDRVMDLMAGALDALKRRAQEAHRSVA